MHKRRVTPTSYESINCQNNQCFQMLNSITRITFWWYIGSDWESCGPFIQQNKLRDSPQHVFQECLHSWDQITNLSSLLTTHEVCCVLSGSRLGECTCSSATTSKMECKSSANGSGQTTVPLESVQILWWEDNIPLLFHLLSYDSYL